MGFFGAAHGWGEGVQKGPLLPKICHKYPAMMKLGTVVRCLKKSQKKYKSHSLCCADISIFYRKSANFAISKNTDIDCILTHNF